MVIQYNKCKDEKVNDITWKNEEYYWIETGVLRRMEWIEWSEEKLHYLITAFDKQTTNW